MVLDEADEMLKMGFVQDVEKIIESADPNRQLVMFSATTNQDVLTVSWKYQHDPIEIVAGRGGKQAEHHAVHHRIRSETKSMSICCICSIRINISA